MGQDGKDYYQTLRVNPDAEPAEIDEAYQLLTGCLKTSSLLEGNRRPLILSSTF